MKKCDVCGTVDSTVETVADPVSEELGGELVEINLCENCIDNQYLAV